MVFALKWASYQIRKIAGCACAGNAGNDFPRHRLQRKLLVSDPGMHHGTCLMHVPWCMSESLTSRGGENVPGIPGACASRNVKYLVRGPWGQGFPSSSTGERWVNIMAWALTTKDKFLLYASNVPDNHEMPPQSHGHRLLSHTASTPEPCFPFDSDTGPCLPAHTMYTWDITWHH